MRKLEDVVKEKCVIQVNSREEWKILYKILNTYWYGYKLDHFSKSRKDPIFILMSDGIEEELSYQNFIDDKYIVYQASEFYENSVQEPEYFNI